MLQDKPEKSAVLTLREISLMNTPARVVTERVVPFSHYTLDRSAKATVHENPYAEVRSIIE